MGGEQAAGTQKHRLLLIGAALLAETPEQGYSVGEAPLEKGDPAADQRKHPLAEDKAVRVPGAAQRGKLPLCICEASLQFCKGKLWDLPLD